MTYLVYARKWRPKKFKEMVGQAHVLRTLINSLDNNRLHHAYLFTGTRGVGKTTIARIFAKCLNCETGVTSQPCGQCSSCVEIEEGRFVDLIEVDAASRTKVEDTRELLENVLYAPARARFKVYIIDEVHMLSTHSFNALLKTLEEPPPHVKFLLATTDPQKLPVTVLSRCIQFYLKPLSLRMIEQHLELILTQENVEFQKSALQLIAHAANGSIRDALSLLDQCVSYGNNKINEHEVQFMLGTISRKHIFNILDALSNQDIDALYNQMTQLEEHSVDYSNVLTELLSTLHRIALIQQIPAASEELEDKETITKLASTIKAEDIQLFYQIGLIGRRDLPLAPNPQIGFEMILLRMLAFQPASLQKLAPNTDANSKKPVNQSNSSAITSSAKIAKPKDNKPNTPITQTSAPTDSPVDIPIDSSVDWNRLVEKLDISGMTRQLAINCNFIKYQNDKFFLEVDLSHKHLYNDRQKERIQSALRLQLKNSINIDIAITDNMQAESPKKLQDRLTQESQDNANQNISEDLKVKAIMAKFDAKIVPNSIQPLNNN